MRIHSLCVTCQSPIDAWLDDSCIAITKCPNGHNFATLLRDRKYRVLLRSACETLLQEHEKDSLGGFAVGLERAYEFFIRVAVRRHGMSQPTFEKTWKKLASQSERQFGAFMVLYTLATNTHFELPEHYVTLRNKITHGGFIPSRQDVLYFASTVVIKVEEIARACENIGPQHMQSVDEESWRELEAKAPSGMPFIWDVPGIVELDADSRLAEEDELDLILRAWVRNFEPRPA